MKKLIICAGFLVIISSFGFQRDKYKSLHFDNTVTASPYKIWYDDPKTANYLNELKDQYGLDKICAAAKSDGEKALQIVHWVHGQWKHDGNQQPEKKDAISILKEASAGKNFRCVEYAIVTAAACNAIGLPARVIGIKTKDMERSEGGAGHVVAEVYLKDVGKWAMLDGQWDVMPALNARLLNAVEFQNAIADNYDKLEIRSLSGVSKKKYVKWVYPYLYYFDTPFDNRTGVGLQRQSVEGKTSIMLMPSDARQPSVFQKTNPLNCLYTRNPIDFYGSPF